jgi:hypothetical protein
MAMKPISDLTLSSVTGQAGVNINADLTMNISIDTLAWGDSDGITGVYSPWSLAPINGGYVGVNNFNISGLRIKARETDTFLWTTASLKPITIDVATGNKSSRGGGATTTFIRFGLGSLEISMNSMRFDVALGDRVGGVVLDQMLGQANLGDLNAYINPASYIDVFAHGASGVTFDASVTLDHLNMSYLTWGDSDGTTNPGIGVCQWMADAAPGYVGLRNLVLGDVTSPAFTLNGTLGIDVNTTASGTYQYNYSMLRMISAAGSPVLDIRNKTQMANFMQFVVDNGYDPSNGTEVAICAHFYILMNGGGNVPVNYVNYPLSVVHFSFPTDFNVQVAKMTADICLGSSPNFTTGNTGTMGDLYIQDLNMNIQAGSWVDIWGH